MHPNHNPTFIRGTAMTTPIVATATHVCQKCNKEKPLTKEFWYPRINRGKQTWSYHACRECQNVNKREKCREYATQRRSTNEGRAALRKAVRKWKLRNPDKVNADHRTYNQRKAAKEGRVYIPKIKRPELAALKQKIRNARIAFRQFIADSSDEEVKCWYAATGKPWLNPRLTNADKDKVRHQFDNEYHIKRRLYYRDRKTQRRFSIKASNDGTLSPQIIKQATHCLYCGAAFGPTCKPTLDHLIPIKKGGSHSAANVVVCCLTCNSRKGSLDYLDWIESIREPYRKKAVAAWRKLRGAPPQQQALIG
jgi:hypothetical protein